MSDERETDQDEYVRQRRIEALAREIAVTINAGPVERREGWRDVVDDLLHEEVHISEPPPEMESPAGPPPGGAFNPFGIGIPLVLMGSVMVFLFPPVGLLLFAAATVMIAWGVGATLLARS